MRPSPMEWPRARSAISAAVAGLVIVTGCGGGAVGTPADVAQHIPDGWTIYTTRQSLANLSDKTLTQGFRIALPPDWDEITSPPTTNMENLTRTTAPGAPTATPAALPSLSFNAGAPALARGHALRTTILVTAQHYPAGELTTEQMAGSMERFRKETERAVLLFRDMTELAGKSWAFLQMRLNVKLPNGDEQMYSTVQFIRVVENEVYIIEFIAPLEEVEGQLPLFRSIAETFRTL